MDKQDYITYLDKLIRDSKDYDISSYEYTMIQLEYDTFLNREVIAYDVFRRRKGLEDFYGTRELMVPYKDYTSRLNLELFKVYKDDLLYLGEVEFLPNQFEYKFLLNDEETSYKISEDKVYMVESTKIRNNSNLFFDIRNKKLITLEGKDFAEYTDN